MQFEFGFYINLPDTAESDRIRDFVKSFYSCVDCIDENVDANSGNSSVCADCLGVDSAAIDYVADSIFKGTLAIGLLKNGFHVTSLGMNLEEIGVAAATFDQDHLDYRAITYDQVEISPDEEGTSVHITGSSKDGFQTETIDGSDELFDEIFDRFSKIMADSF